MSEPQVNVNPPNFNVKGPVFAFPPNWNANALQTNTLYMRTNRVPEWEIKENPTTLALEFYLNNNLVYTIPAPPSPSL